MSYACRKTWWASEAILDGLEKIDGGLMIVGIFHRYPGLASPIGFCRRRAGHRGYPVVYIPYTLYYVHS